jgi:hypothetical protein
MRKPNHADAELLIRLYELRRDPELRKAREWFLTKFKPAGWADIKARYLSFDDEDRWFRQATSYWELVGTLVNQGVLHPTLFFDHTGEDIVAWERCKIWIDGARADIRATYLYQFEQLVRDHLAFRAKTIPAFLAAQSKRAAAANGKSAVVAPRAAAKAGKPSKVAARSARRAPASR